jgi:hypothetical protein
MYNEMFKFYGDDIYKIGKSKDIAKRMTSYTTSYIKPVEVKFISELCVDYNMCERIVFDKLKNHRITANREFFNMNIEKLVATIEESVANINHGIGLVRTEKKSKRVTPVIEDVEPIILDEYLHVSEQDRNHGRYDQLKLNLRYLNFYETDNETIRTFSDVITCKEKINQFFNLGIYMDDYMTEDPSRDPARDVYEATTKVQLIKRLESALGISSFEIDFAVGQREIVKNYDSEAHFINDHVSDELFQSIKKAFRLSIDKPTSLYKCQQLYVKILRHITPIEMITSYRSHAKDTTGIRRVLYKLNKDALNRLFLFRQHFTSHTV